MVMGITHVRDAPRCRLCCPFAILQILVKLFQHSQMMNRLPRAALLCPEGVSSPLEQLKTRTREIGAAAC